MDDLYFMQTSNGPIKIGRAGNVRKRLASLRTGSAEPIELIGVAPGWGYQEKVWHSAFKDYRIRGEWFYRSDALEKAIAHALKGEEWWNHLRPPFDFECADEDDVVDWHIGIMISLVGDVALPSCPVRGL